MTLDCEIAAETKHTGVRLTEPEQHFLAALAARGGVNVDPPPLRTDPDELYRADDRAGQSCRKRGLAAPVKPRSPRWSITPAGLLALSQKGSNE